MLRFLLVAALVGPAMIVAAFFELTYHKAVRDAETIIHSSLGVLHAHTTKILDIHELILDRLAIRLDVPDTPQASRDASQRLKWDIPGQTLVAAVWATDPNGEITISSLAAQGLNARGRGYFEEQREADRGIYIGTPQTGRASGERILTLSRRRPSRDGSFAGVIASSIKTQPLELFLEQMLGTGAHAASLIRSDGQILARFPANYDVLQLPAASIERVIAAADDHRFRWIKSTVDNVERLWGWRKLDEHPVYVGFGLSREAILADWWRALVLSGLAALAVTLALAGAIVLALKRIKQERLAQQQLLAEVSERNRVETALHQAQKMEAIGQLTGGLSHDFNNLLGIVIGNLDFLKDRLQSDPEGSEALNEALEASLRGAELNKRLLAFARRQPLRPERVDVGALVSATVRLLERTLGEQVETRFAATGDVGCVMADPAQLEAALTNLAVNARDAMPKGGRLSIEAHRRYLDAQYAAENPDVEPGDYALIEVTDTGTGIDSESLKRVFDPFFTTKEVGKGTGLGLSMVFGFVKQSGGHVKIYSEVGTGTTVRLYLPRIREEADSSLPDRVPLEIPRAAGGEVVLAVEDNDALRLVLAKQLKELGYTVLQAEAGRAALEILKTDVRIDLMLTDIVMPGGLNGHELAQEALTMRPGLKVLFSSGFPDSSFAPGPHAGGKLLGKPYRKDELAQRVRETLAA